MKANTLKNSYKLNCLYESSTTTCDQTQNCSLKIQQNIDHLQNYLDALEKQNEMIFNQYQAKLRDLSDKIKKQQQITKVINLQITQVKSQYNFIKDSLQETLNYISIQKIKKQQNIIKKGQNDSLTPRKKSLSLKKLKISQNVKNINMKNKGFLKMLEQQQNQTNKQLKVKIKSKKNIQQVFQRGRHFKLLKLS